jgi:hypothetical protein
VREARIESVAARPSASVAQWNMLKVVDFVSLGARGRIKDDSFGVS